MGKLYAKTELRHIYTHNARQKKLKNFKMLISIQVQSVYEMPPASTSELLQYHPCVESKNPP